MKLSHPLFIAPLLASPWAAAHETGCHADNCLRALRNPTRAAAATSFCHSYTQAIVTATTALPTQFATPCGSGPTQSSRLSSACSCYVSPTSCGDTSSDNNNCGTCGHSCASGTTCQSGVCIPPNPGPGTNCTSFTASCSDVIKDILASNSIASPQLVDLRLQTAILGITSPADFLKALGPNPCKNFTDPAEHDACVKIIADPALISQLTDLTTQALTSFQTCASTFASGGQPDYQVTIGNGTACAGSRILSARRHTTKRDTHDLTPNILQAIAHSRRMTSDLTPSLGKMKKSSSSNLLQLVRRQELENTCAQTGECFEQCPSCRDQQTYCGETTAILTGAVCGAAGAIAGIGVGAASCGPVCGTLAGTAVTAACRLGNNYLCEQLKNLCANCNAANGNICNADSTQCCAGETGTQCGDGCCCCPECQAPGGINCACTAAPC